MIKPIALVGFLAFAIFACFGQSNSRNTPQPLPQVTVLEFADFQCPFCARQAADFSRLRAEYSGRVTFVFKNFPLSFHKQSRGAHLAALAAARQGKFWEMHDLIYANPQHLSVENFDIYASKLGLHMDEFRNAVADPAGSALIDQDIAEGKSLGISGTPTFVVDGHKLVGRQSYARLKQIIEGEINGQPWPVAGKIQVDIANAPSRGPASAVVTIVEFADFQCPFCARAVQPLIRLLNAYPDEVRLVFKNFPLESHSDSQAAHMAALAAGEQGKFWEMHNLIYAHQHAMKSADLLNMAEQLHLNMARFQKDLDSAELKARVNQDRMAGERAGVTATPTFIVDGELFSGFDATKLQTKIEDLKNGRKTTDAQRGLSELSAIGIRPESLSLGPQDAPLTIEWFVDLTSPLTAKSAVALQQFLSAHPGQVSVRFKNFPLPTHPEATIVHEFALAAAAQGKFWEVESLLLADREPKGRQELKVIASEAQLDEKKLWEEVDAHKYFPIITLDLLEAKRRGVSGTPTFIVGDKQLDGTNGLTMLP